MIKYRDLDYSKDIADVVELINDNLDPDYTRESLLWKHFHNPFGRSISMVALDDEKIVAVVFYMRYNFQNNNGEIIRSLRPLDVCTDKTQRGKGLFKILLEKCLKKHQDYDILFSTPNKKSYPEFIKLGWSPLINYKFKFGLINPLTNTGCIGIEDLNLINPVDENLNIHRYFTTATSLSYLTWRFKDSDYIVKRIYKKDQTGYLIYRVDKVKKIKCIILCDYLGNENLLSLGLKKVCRIENIFSVYYLDNELNKKINFLITASIRLAVIIYKEKDFILPKDFLISLADLEGRL